MAFLMWITGLSGSGKTTIAKKVYKKLKLENPNTVLLDGDDYRKIVGKKSGYSLKERLTIALQIARICKFLVNQDINVVCSTISLFRTVHQYNRKHMTDYFEIFVDCGMHELMRRDKKKIYSSAVKGELTDVVGIDIPYDTPKSHLVVDNNRRSNLKRNVAMILESFHNRNFQQ